MTEAEMLEALRRLGEGLDEMLAGADEIERRLDVILGREPAQQEGEAA